MALYTILISKDNGWEVMNELGKASILHFLDLNQQEPLFNRIYASTIKRCDETERKVKFIEEEARRFSITSAKPETVEQFFTTVDSVQQSRMKVGNTLLDDYESELTGREAFLKEQSKKFQEMQEKRKWLIEYKHVLNKTREVLNQKSTPQEITENIEPLLGVTTGIKFANLSGVINTSDCDRFKKLIFRMSRGIF